LKPPGDADHADRTAAPWLGREPGDHLDRVVLLLLQIFAQEHTFAVAAAADVHPDRGIAMAGEIGMREVIALGRAVPAPVRQIFQDRRHRIAIGLDRPPDSSGQMNPVRKRDPDIVEHANLLWKLLDDTHARPPMPGENGADVSRNSVGKPSPC